MLVQTSLGLKQDLCQKLEKQDNLTISGYWNKPNKIGQENLELIECYYNSRAMDKQKTCIHSEEKAAITLEIDQLYITS